jgi:peptidylprolyl isomerase
MHRPTRALRVSDPPISPPAQPAAAPRAAAARARAAAPPPAPTPPPPSRRAALAAAAGLAAALAAPPRRAAAFEDDPPKLLCDAACAEALAGRERVTTPSGLQFQDLVVGDGPAPPVGFQVVLDYVMSTPEGRVFASSLDRGSPYDSAF